MPILYSVVARGTTVLAKYASCSGNFAEVTDQILTKIPPENGKLTLSHGSYLFHYISEDRIIYMCITDDEFERSRAFLYLTEIKRRFKSTYGSRSETAIAYAMNNEFSPTLNNEMKHYSESRDIDTISRVHGELDELKNIMVRNIDNVAMRGERLELLVNKTENLSASSVTFRAQSRNLQRSLFWKNMKLYFIMGGIVITPGNQNQCTMLRGCIVVLGKDAAVHYFLCIFYNSHNKCSSTLLYPRSVVGLWVPAKDSLL